MSAEILNGKEVAEYIRNEIAKEVELLQEKNIKPAFRIILIGENPASMVYVKNKKKTSLKIGIDADIIHYDEDIEEKKIIDKIRELNEDKNINGIIVQLPLPTHINSEKVAEYIDPAKDIDGFHPFNLGRLLRGDPLLLPATPAGIVELLRYYRIETEGKKVVIVGRSNIVGKPCALMFLLKRKMGNATVTVCHSLTKNLSLTTREADIIIVAAGRREMIDGDMIKPGAVVVDVGIHRVKTGEKSKLVGDVNFEEVKEKARWISPVPGGVGPMTVTMLLKNVVLATKFQHKLWKNS